MRIVKKYDVRWCDMAYYDVVCYLTLCGVCCRCEWILWEKKNIPAVSLGLRSIERWYANRNNAMQRAATTWDCLLVSKHCLAKRDYILLMSMLWENPPCICLNHCLSLESSCGLELSILIDYCLFCVFYVVSLCLFI